MKIMKLCHFFQKEQEMENSTILYMGHSETYFFQGLLDEVSEKQFHCNGFKLNMWVECLYFITAHVMRLQSYTWLIQMILYNYLQVRLYGIHIPDAEIDAHWQDAGMIMEVHKRYLTLHYNMDNNPNGE